MQILSATDAISPALTRTKLILYTPFRKGRTWKLSATAYLSFAGTIFLPFTLLYGIAALAVPGLSATLRTILIVLSFVLTVIYAVVFWLCGHLKFAFFDMVLNRGEFVTPAWRKYTDQSRKWSLVKMLVGSFFTAILSVPAYAAVRHFLRAIPQWKSHMEAIGPNPGVSPDFQNAMIAFYGAYFLACIVIGAYFLVLSTVSSFVVPTMALENASVGAAFARFVAFCKREPGQLFAFVGVRFGLALVGYFGVIFAYEIVLFILIAVVALVCGMAGLMLHLLGVPTPVLLVLGAVIFAFVLISASVYLMMLALGPFFTFFEAHTLYFLGGRYPLLGELLERSTPPPVYPAVQSYGAGYYVPPPT